MSHGGNVWQGGDPALWQDHSANLRPEGMPDWVRDALYAAVDSAVYYPQVSMEKARAALADFLGAGSAYVLPAAGGISALDLITRLGAKRVVTVNPCFCEYAELAEKHGSPVERVSLLSGRHKLDTSLEAVCDAVRANDSVRLCTPLNPVGVGFGADAIERLLSACESKDAQLVVDEAFIDYCPGRSVRSLVTEHAGLIITGSLTKVLSIPGVRLGYLCASPGIIERAAALQTTWELNCFAERVLTELPKHRYELERDARINTVRREKMRELLEALGMFVYPSDASFLLVDTGRDAHRVAELLKEKHILVRECMDFKGIDDGRHLRLAVRTEQENERLVTALREAMQCAESH